MRDLITRARAELTAALKLRKRIQDPKHKETQKLIQTHKRGFLTAYPLASIQSDADKPKKETPMPVPTNAGSVFVSYAHKDEEWLNRLLTMASPIIRNNAVSVWYDKKIKPGQKWRVEIDKAMASAKVALLLVSPDFLASDFINDEELPYLLNAADTREVKILWVLLRHCLYDHTPIKDYQAAHEISKPLNSLSEPELDAALVHICNTLESAPNSSPPRMRYLEEVYWEVREGTIVDGPFCPRCGEDKRARMRESFVDGVADMSDVRHGGHIWECHVCGHDVDRNPSGLKVGTKVDG